MHTDRFTPLDAATLLRWMQHDLPTVSKTARRGVASAR